MNISDEAVEAAAKAVLKLTYPDDSSWDDWGPRGHARLKSEARFILQAAAPHLMAAEDARRRSESLAAFPYGVTTSVSRDETGALTVTHSRSAGAGE